MSDFRSGFATFVGRPNVGKSTLTNAIVGSKVAITSSKPQTTRKAIRGIHTTQEGQLVLVDTPGIHKPRTLLGQRLNAVVDETLGSVDVIAFCSPVTDAIGPGDRRIVEEIQKFPKAKKIAIATKIDAAGRDQTARHLIELSELADWEEIVPVSALTGKQVDLLVGLLIGLMPAGPMLYPQDQSTEEENEDIICELVREAALERLEEELPHSLAVTLDEILREDKKKIFLSVWVERDSQKGIIIGKGGKNLKEIGSKARAAIEQHLGEPVHLAIQVKVASNWQQDPKQLGKLGF
ncbi:MAG: GTPase Era [Candidatus Aquiluna sp. XM-24bin5]|nr:MAG: GTPase Era [Candidatus Aquiluna sp. XM-24bin5]